MKIYPELAKMNAIKDKSQTIGEFLDWLNSTKKIYLAEHKKVDVYYESELELVYISIEDLLAEYFEIDLDKVEEEKRDILNDLKNENYGK